MRLTFVFFALFVAGASVLWAENFPELIGDGVADDTSAIQARLDAGSSCVSLPPPAKAYRISKTLKIGSGQELRLDRFSVIRLAPQSNCPMIENRCYAGGGTNEFLAVTGGIWDMDNLNQRANFMVESELRKEAPEAHNPSFFFGMALRFNNVANMTLRGVTVRNPTTYGIELAHASYVSVEDIVFDYRTWNSKRINMDGVHLDGWSHHVRIANLRGTCFDDMVALNANDGICSPGEGPISDIDIDGIYCDYCHSGVRLLSAPAPVSNVTIRNVHGNFYISAVWLTHWRRERPTGRFDNIVISDVFAAKTIPPPEVDCGWRRALALILVEEKEEVGNLVLQRIFRDEKTLSVPTFAVRAPTTRIENLVIRDCRMVNRLDTPIKFVDNRGSIDKFVSENNEFVGSWTDLDGRNRPADGRD